MQEITASERQEAKVNRVVRAVAPKTLGLPFNRLACSEEHDVGPDGSVDAKAHEQFDHLIADAIDPFEERFITHFATYTRRLDQRKDDLLMEEMEVNSDLEDATEQSEIE